MNNIQRAFRDKAKLRDGLRQPAFLADGGDVLEGRGMPLLGNVSADHRDYEAIQGISKTGAVPMAAAMAARNASVQPAPAAPPVTPAPVQPAPVQNGLRTPAPVRPAPVPPTAADQLGLRAQYDPYAALQVTQNANKPAPLLPQARQPRQIFHNDYVPVANSIQIAQPQPIQWLADGGQPEPTIRNAAGEYPAPPKPPEPTVFDTLRSIFSKPRPVQKPGTTIGIRAAHGGAIHGPGTGTSDSIPAMLSKGEYVLPADTVRHVGKENLDRLRDATHTPTHDAQAMRKGAMSGVSHLERGGRINEAVNDLRKSMAGYDSTVANTGQNALENAYTGQKAEIAARAIPSQPLPAPDVWRKGATAPTNFASPRLSAQIGADIAQGSADAAAYKPERDALRGVQEQVRQRTNGFSPGERANFDARVAQQRAAAQAARSAQTAPEMLSNMNAAAAEREAARLAANSVGPAPAAAPAATPIPEPAAAPRTGWRGVADKVRGAGSSAAGSVKGVKVLPALGNGLRAVGNFAKQAGPAISGLDGAYRGLNTNNEDYAARAGIDMPDSQLGQLGLRAAGVLSDVGASTLDAPSHLYNMTMKPLVKALSGGKIDVAAPVYSDEMFGDKTRRAAAATSAPTSPASPRESGSFSDERSFRQGDVAPNDWEARNATQSGLSVDAQRGAFTGKDGEDMTARMRSAPATGLRDSGNKGFDRLNARDYDIMNDNLKSAVGGMRDGVTYNMTNKGKGGDGDIFASKDANGRLVLTGTGSGPDTSRAKPYDAAAMQRTADLQREVSGLRVAENDQGATNFSGGKSQTAQEASVGGDLRSGNTGLPFGYDKMTHGDKSRYLQNQQAGQQMGMRQAEVASQQQTRNDTLNETIRNNSVHADISRATAAATLSENRLKHDQFLSTSTETNRHNTATEADREDQRGIDAQRLEETERNNAKDRSRSMEATYIKRLETQFPKDADGVQDPRVARYASSIHKGVSAAVNQLREEGRDKEAESLATQGPDALGADGFERFQAASDIRERFLEMQPKYFGGAKGQVSDNPLDFLNMTQKGDKVFFGNPDAKGKYKMEMDVEDLQYAEIPSRLGITGLASGPQRTDLLKYARKQ